MADRLDPLPGESLNEYMTRYKKWLNNRAATPLSKWAQEFMANQQAHNTNINAQGSSLSEAMKQANAELVRNSEINMLERMWSQPSRRGN